MSAIFVRKTSLLPGATYSRLSFHNANDAQTSGHSGDDASSVLTSCRIARLANVKISEISVVMRFKNKNDA